MDKAAELLAERAVNDQYRKNLHKSVASGTKLVREMPRGSGWVDDVARPVLGSVPREAIEARVDLDDELLPNGFYIGPWHCEFEGVFVASLFAPVSKLFYGHEDSTWSLKSVRARRTFVVADDDFVDFADEVRPGVDPRDVFKPATKALSVPAPPAAAQPPAWPSATRDFAVGAESAAGSNTVAAQRLSDIESRFTDELTSLRAGVVVAAKVVQPRSGRLESVLGTIQPDQYGLISWPRERALIAQGQPGTGKTIVAVHRAAFLVSPDSAYAEPLKRVALIGPTENYRRHVEATLQMLRADAVEVHSVGSLLNRLVPWANLEPRPDQGWASTSRELGEVVRSVCQSLSANDLRGSAKDKVHLVVNRILEHARVRADVENPDAVSLWLSGFASSEHVIEDPDCLPMLALIALETDFFPASKQLDHVVVDEAQDIRPLEWQILRRLVRSDQGWSLLGDIQQRRCAWSNSSWAEVASDLGLTHDGGSWSGPERLGLSFRSTQQILTFASMITPDASDRPRALRNGPDPRSEYVPQHETVGRTIDEAELLAERYSAGLTAVIAMVPDELERECRKRGWRRQTGSIAFVRDGKRLAVLKPSEARGLEFDAVVVVEPASFPRGGGRDGLLYTSLTRATQELVVLGSVKEPAALFA